MKKLTLASAVALVSTGANSTPVVAYGDILVPHWSPPNSLTAPCASTWAGGADGFVLDVAASTASGTVCFDIFGTGAPYVMLGISMSSSYPSGSPLIMDGGAIQMSLDWSSSPAWAAYTVINVATNPISCTSSGGTPKLSCAFPLISIPFTHLM